MESVGIDNLLNLFHENLIGQYNNMIQKHCIFLVKNIMDEIIPIETKLNPSIIMKIVENFICAYNTFNLHMDTNMCENQDNIKKSILLTENEQEMFIGCINKHLTELSINLINDQFSYDFLEKCLDLIKKYIKTFEINNEQINFVIIKLMKNKMKYKFNEELFNSLIDDANFYLYMLLGSAGVILLCLIIIIALCKKKKGHGSKEDVNDIEKSLSKNELKKQRKEEKKALKEQKRLEKQQRKAEKKEDKAEGEEAYNILKDE